MTMRLVTFSSGDETGTDGGDDVANQSYNSFHIIKL